MELTDRNTNYSKFTSPWKVFAIFVEAASHNTISGVESFFYTVSVMHVYIDIENTCMISDDKFNASLILNCRIYRRSSSIPSTMSERESAGGDFRDNARTIYIAETTGFAFFRVMKTSSPIHSDITFIPA
jgi:hypothetical protein